MLALDTVFLFHNKDLAAGLEQLIPSNGGNNFGEQAVGLQERSLVSSSMQFSQRRMDVVVRITLLRLTLINLIEDALRKNGKHDARRLWHARSILILVCEHWARVES
jgi:hypothetical protein